MKVSGIYVYPVKSCGGIAKEHQQLDDLGLEYDRQWMIVNQNHLFRTQRQIHKMALIKTDINNNSLILQAPGMTEIYIPIARKVNRSLTEVEIWGKNCLTIDEGDEVSKWLSDFLGQECRLVRLSEQHARLSDDKKSKMAFLDSYPILVISEPSLEDLNKRLDKSVPMDRFRPSIVFSEGQPYQEDELSLIQINNVVFRGTEQCVRCVIPNINQSTGKKEGNQPYSTLETYKYKVAQTDKGEVKKVLFGKYFSHENLGAIQLGDEVKLLS